MPIRIILPILFSLNIACAATDTKSTQAAPAPRTRLVLDFLKATTPEVDSALDPEDTATLRKDIEGLLRSLGIDLVEGTSEGLVPVLHLAIHVSREKPENIYVLSFRASFDKDAKAAIFAGAVRHREGMVDRLRNRLGMGVTALLRKTPGLALTNVQGVPIHADPVIPGFPPKDIDFAAVRVGFQPSTLSYPPLAKIARVQGTVVVRITTSEEGVPELAEAVEGPEFLRMAAVQFAMKWRFKPQSEKGSPIPIRFKLNIVFRLR